MNNLRLKSISNVFCERIIYDIGSDHAYLPLDLFKNNKIDYAHICEINQGPLDNATKTLRRTGFIKHSKLYLSDGLKNVDMIEANSGCVVAGMGGNLIASIIQDSCEKFKKFNHIYLQPNNNEANLRKYLAENNFEIISEYLVMDDGIIYTVLQVCYSKVEQILTFEEIKYGLINNKNELFIIKWNSQIEHLNRIYMGIKNDQNRINELKSEIVEIENYLGKE